MRPMRQAGWENPSCLSVIILHHILHTHFYNRQPNIGHKDRFLLGQHWLPLPFIINPESLNLPEGTFLFYGLSIYGSKFPYLHIRFRAADLIFVAKVRAMPFLSARSCRTVPGKISISRLAEIVFGRETLHKEPCHLVWRHNQISPGSSDATKGKNNIYSLKQ